MLELTLEPHPDALFGVQRMELAICPSLAKVCD